MCLGLVSFPFCTPGVDEHVAVRLALLLPENCAPCLETAGTFRWRLHNKSRTEAPSCLRAQEDKKKRVLTQELGDFSESKPGHFVRERDSRNRFNFSLKISEDYREKKRL